MITKVNKDFILKNLRKKYAMYAVLYRVCARTLPFNSIISLLCEWRCLGGRKRQWTLSSGDIPLLADTRPTRRWAHPTPSSFTPATVQQLSLGHPKANLVP